MAVPPPFPDPLPFPAAADRAALRGMLRARRLAFAQQQGADGAAAIDRRLAPLSARAGPIAGYMAHRGEPDVLPFLLGAFHLGHCVALPHIDAAGRMDFLHWQPDAVMQPGLAGIAQPAGGEPVTPAIVLAPLLGFDRTGHRLGQGGGFYDRWFAAHPQAMRIGIAWSVQEVDALAAEPWDMPLHAIVTEKEWIAP